MELQVPYCICTKISQTNNIRKTTKLRVEEGLYMYCIGNCKICTENCDDFNNIKVQAKRASDKIIKKSYQQSLSHS